MSWRLLRRVRAPSLVLIRLCDDAVGVCGRTQGRGGLEASKDERATRETSEDASAARRQQAKSSACEERGGRDWAVVVPPARI